MAVSVLGVQAGTASTATSYSLTTPSQLNIATTTLLVTACASTADTSTQTPPSGWALNGYGLMSGIGVCMALFERDTPSYISNKIPSNDQPSTGLSITTANATSTGRNAAAITIGGGAISAYSRAWRTTIPASSSLATNSSVLWALPVYNPTNGCVSGDKIIIVMAGSRYDADATITAGNMGLTNITKHAFIPGDAAGTPALSVWSADATSTQIRATAPTITISNPAGAAGGYGLWMYCFHPTDDNATQGSGGAPIRVAVTGDSITHGGAFGGALNGESSGESPERWIDRLFGTQATAIGATLNFQSNTTVTINHTAAALPWYSGSYTPYDGSPTTSVRIRNMGQGGWDTVNHLVAAHRPRLVANPQDSGISPDIYIINLGANDEKGVNTTQNTAANFRDSIFSLATVYMPAPYVILVKQWAWAFDYVNGSAFARQSGQTHSLFLTAIDDAATLIRATGRTCIVVDVGNGVSAEASGGTSVPTVTAGVSFSGVVASSGTSADNIHGNAASHLNTWAPTIRTGLDQIPLLNPVSVSTWKPQIISY